MTFVRASNPSGQNVNKVSTAVQQRFDIGQTAEARPLKIATFNTTNINKRLNNLTDWLGRAQPDVVSLQDLKVEQRAFPASTLRDLGYGGVWLGERSWNGVAILTRECDQVLTRSTCLGIPLIAKHAISKLRDVLGLRAQWVAFRQGDAPGSFSSLSRRVRAAGRRGVDRWGSRRGKRERPRSRVDRARVIWMKNTLAADLTVDAK